MSTTSSASPAARESTRQAGRDWPAAVAGIVATATALGVSELLAGLLSGATSLVASVGQVVIDLQPPGAKDVVVGLFGTNDKLALEVLIVAVALLIGAGLGLLARRRFALAAGAFAAFGVVGFLAALGDPLVVPEIAIVSAAVSVGAGLFVLGWLLDASAAPAPSAATTDRSRRARPVATMPDWSRRSFLIRAGGVGVAAVVAGLRRPAAARAPARRAGRVRAAHPAGVGDGPGPDARRRTCRRRSPA